MLLPCGEPRGSAAASLDALRFRARDASLDGGCDAIHRSVDLVQALGSVHMVFTASPYDLH